MKKRVRRQSSALSNAQSKFELKWSRVGINSESRRHSDSRLSSNRLVPSTSRFALPTPLNLAHLTRSETPKRIHDPIGNTSFLFASSTPSTSLLSTRLPSPSFILINPVHN